MYEFAAAGLGGEGLGGGGDLGVVAASSQDHLGGGGGHAHRGSAVRYVNLYSHMTIIVTYIWLTYFQLSLSLSFITTED